LLRAEILAAADAEYVTVVVPAPDFKVWRTKYVQAQLRQQLGRSVQTNTDQQTILMWITEDCFVDRVTAFYFSIDYFKTERCFRNAVDLAGEVSAFIVKKCFSVGHEKLQVADLRGVDRWIVHLSDASLIERVPNAAGS